MGPNDTAIPAPGSIADVAARLALWGRRAPKGLARVEFDSDFSRQDVVADLRQRLEAANVPFHEIALPLFEPADRVVQFLLDRLASLESGVVSITGWATAFPVDTTLIESLRVLNYNRENLAQFPLCQIWWLTRRFADTFIHTTPDFNSWFLVQLSLTESRTVVVEAGKSSEVHQAYAASLDAALKTSAELVSRFHQAVKAKASPSDLLTLAWPAVIAIHNFGLRQEAQHLAETLLDETINLAVSQGILNNRREIEIDPVSAWGRIFEGEFNAPMYIGNIAFFYDVQAKAVEAEALYKRALALAIETMSNDYPLINFALNTLALWYRAQRRYDEAIPLYKYISERLDQPPKDVYEKSAFRAALSDCYYDLADTYLEQGNLAEAEKSYHHVLATQRQYLGANAYQLIWVLRDLSKFYAILGRSDEAELYQKRAAELDSVPTPQSTLVTETSVLG